MVLDRYNTYLNYANETGINQIAYPVRDAIPLLNPFFVVLLGFLMVLTVGSYYTFANFVGRTRFFNSLLASSFTVTVISFFFALAGWITPIHVFTFIGITAIGFIAVVFYK